MTPNMTTRIITDGAGMLYLIVEYDACPVYVGEFRMTEEEIKVLAEGVADPYWCSDWDYNMLDENPNIVDELESDDFDEIESVYLLETPEWTQYYDCLEDVEDRFTVMCWHNKTDTPVRIVDALTGRIVKEQDMTVEHHLWHIV